MPKQLVAAITAAAQGAAPLVAAPTWAAQAIGCPTSTKLGMRALAGAAHPPHWLTLVPYHLWANRGLATMRVWLPRGG